MTDTNGKANTQIIKQSLCYRAKYNVDGPDSDKITLHTLAVGLVVPHPKNRGGEACKSMRTQELTGDITFDGCDVVEAKGNAVAVQAIPEGEARGAGVTATFQQDFEEKTKADPEMAPKLKGLTALAGSLSHSHFNCSCRNILAGKKGCQCDLSVVTECKCKAKPILTTDGRYDMEKLKTHDKRWHDLIMTGLPWELLSWKMEVEEPKAAAVISIALNKHNEAAMKTSHTEIMNFLAGLCNPDPRTGTVPWEPVRDKMVELYGAAVDHPDFFQAFTLVMSVGGGKSLHIKDLQKFIDTFVNPKNRKMRFEAYPVVTAIGIDYPKLKMASLKWAYRQPTTRGWCVLPPSISHRVDKNSKFAMTQLMGDLDEVLGWMSKCAKHLYTSEAVSQHNMAKWICKVDVGTMTKIFAACKSPKDGQTVHQQEQALAEECSEFLARKLVDLKKDIKAFSAVADIALVAHLIAIPEIGDIPDRDNVNGVNVARLIKDVLSKPLKEEKKEKEDTPKEEKKQLLAPTAIQLNAEGRPITEYEVRAKEGCQVELIQWSRWLDQVQAKSKTVLCKSLLLAAVAEIWDYWPRPPIAMFRKQGKLICKTTQEVKKHGLLLPLFFRNFSSTIDPGGAQKPHPLSVEAELTWPTTEAERERGEEAEEHRVDLVVQPELKLPKSRGDGQELEWTTSDHAHPFWAIKRQDKADDKYNLHLALVDQVFVATLDEIKNEEVKAAFAKAQIQTQATTFTIRLPVLMNDADIQADTELILRHHVQPKEKKQAAPKSWVDEHSAAEKRRRLNLR